MSLLIVSFLTAIAVFILLLKINISFFIRHSAITDVVLSTALAVIYAGTYSGMVTGVLAGLFISLFLYISGKINTALIGDSQWD